MTLAARCRLAALRFYNDPQLFLEAADELERLTPKEKPDGAEALQRDVHR